MLADPDLKACFVTASGAVRADAAPCATRALAGLRANLATLLSGLRAAVDPGVPIVGLTYPDVWLGQWTRDTPAARTLAADSVTLFHDAVNPRLRTTYAAAGATFVDVTAASGAYQPLTETVADPTWGTVPAAVARVCTLTYACSEGDVHPTTAGYTLIADAVREAVPAP